MFFEIAAFALPLGLDTLALALALGLKGFRPWRPALLFTIFEGVMPVFGIGAARILSRRFETSAVIVGGLVLIALGMHTIRHAVGEKEAGVDFSFSSWRSLLVAGLSISTDELAAGFPLGASGLPVGWVLLTIAAQTFLITVFGIAIGNRARSALALNASRYAGITAGSVFALIGLWLIAQRIAPFLRLIS